MATATIKKKTGDWFSETESVTLVLTPEEAATVRIMCGETIGTTARSPAGHTLAILSALTTTGMPERNSKRMDSPPDFADDDIRDYFK